MDVGSTYHLCDLGQALNFNIISFKTHDDNSNFLIKMNCKVLNCQNLIGTSAFKKNLRVYYVLGTVLDSWDVTSIESLISWYPLRDKIN